jgi:DUF3060 family protein
MNRTERRSMAMARTISLTAAAVAGALLTTSAALLAADPAVNFAGSNTRFSGDCRGQDASLAGSGNTVTIRGACRAFQIAGDGNRALVDMMANGTIKVFGNNNEVSWTSAGEVEVTTVGPGNRVTRAR